MVELRLHLELYAADAISEAVRIFAPHGELAVVDDAPYRVVRVSASSPERERAIAGELGNYAFGLTVNAPKADEDAASSPAGASADGRGSAAEAPPTNDEEVEP